ncbi:mRNA turnover protein 4 homolog [Physella acuta]|uniref:mRNA turnover protein 4 homolog n=1 Tax=Physella acuta TaxID=109671 RepID=UPI0027DBEED5|nr:mRNA turnover protein 4 homolog [Physella acuta]
MPKSKRDKKVSLTQTRKKGLELKQKLIERIRETADQYARIFTFSVHNMRNVQLKEIRQQWNHSRFFFGKNKVMQLALGRTADEEYRENLHKLTQHLQGQTGLLFTNSKEKEVLTFFDELYIPDYARSGAIATQTVVLEEGPLPEFSHSLEPQLRQLGLPTQLKKGVIQLLNEHTVCEKGQVLNPEQCRILKLFGHQMAEFHITIDGMWSNTGKWKKFDSRPEHILPSKVKVKPKKDDSKTTDDLEAKMDDDEEEEGDEDEEDDS